MAREIRNAVLFGQVPQLMFIVAATRFPMPLELFYILLFLILGIQVYFFERDNPKIRVVETRQYQFRQAPRQAGAGALIGLLIALPAIFWGQLIVGPSIFSDFVTQAIFVSFVETLYLIVFVETLWYKDRQIGIWIWPLAFGFLHVREEVLAGSLTNLTFFKFSYAAVFGALFWILYAARDLLPESSSRWFGAVTSWTAHLVVNMSILVFRLVLWGLELFPLQIGG